MKRSRIPSFRGMHALIVHSAGSDRIVLQSQLERLGLQVSAVDVLSAWPARAVDVVFFDADAIAGGRPEDDAAAPVAGVPSVALLGSEAPSRLEAVLAVEPSAYLVKPIRRTGIYSCLAIALHRFAIQREAQQRLRALEQRLRRRRAVVSAVVRLMQHGGTSEEAAFRVLQRGAMSRRISIEELSQRIVLNRHSVAQLLSDAELAPKRLLG